MNKYVLTRKSNNKINNATNITLKYTGINFDGKNQRQIILNKSVNHSVGDNIESIIILLNESTAEVAESPGNPIFPRE